MRYLSTFVCLLLLLLCTPVTFAAEEEGKQSSDRGNRRAEMRQKIVDEFDSDGDGELSDEERSIAREEMRERRGRGPRGEGDRHGPPDPEKVFEKFDADGDGQLSRDEFMKLSEEMRPPREAGRRGRAGRGRADDRGRPDRDRPDRDRPGRERPPRGDRPRFDRERPLQNPEDRPGPPPRGEGRRHLYDDDGPPPPRGPGRRRPGQRGGEGFRPPAPEQVFDRFDENGDDQLSREEFMKLSERMRELRERMSRDHEHGMHEGRGPRRGPPRGDESPRRRRPLRPELEDSSGQ